MQEGSRELGPSTGVLWGKRIPKERKSWKVLVPHLRLSLPTEALVRPSCLWPLPMRGARAIYTDALLGEGRGRQV